MKGPKRGPTKKKHQTKWWVSTVVLTFFPTLALIVMSILRSTPVEIGKLINNGELILSAFLIVTSTLFDCYNAGGKRFPEKAEKVYYGLILIDALELIAYTTIRTNSKNEPMVVYIASALSTLTSIYVSRLWNQMEKGDEIDYDHNNDL